MPSPTWQLDPSSPEAASTVTPSAAASWNVSLTASIAAALQSKPKVSNSPQAQLIDSTDGALAASWTAVVMTSTQPCSVQGAKYTAIRAPGATDPATSMSRVTSVSGDAGLPDGEFAAPSTPTGVSVGAGRPRPVKYAVMSLAV